MPIVVVANPKGGAGKSTLSTNIAGYFARQGYAVMHRGCGSAAVLCCLVATAASAGPSDCDVGCLVGGCAAPPARHHPRGAGHTRWLAMQGLTLFDVQPGRVAKDLEAWAPITAWLDRS